MLKSIASDVDVRCLGGRNPAAHQLSYAEKNGRILSIEILLTSKRDPVIMVYQFYNWIVIISSSIYSKQTGFVHCSVEVGSLSSNLF